MYTTPLPYLQVFDMNQIKHIRLEKIKPPDFDNRLTINVEEDNSLKESIRELGVLEPILVKEVPDGYEIIIGNRRFTQAGKAGLAAVPCVVLKTTGAVSEKIKIHENLKRLPLSDVDQAYTFAHLIKEFKMTEQQVATLVGKSIAYVSQHLSLLQTDNILLQAVQDGRINFSVARELMRCKDSDERQRLCHIVEDNGATTGVVHSWVNEANRESDILDAPGKESRQLDLPGKSPELLYPCAACEHPIPISKIRIVRLCENCHYLIFSEIEREKQKARQQMHQEPTKSSP